MNEYNYFKHWLTRRRHHMPYKNILQLLHVDVLLLCGIFTLVFVGLLILYSAGNQNIDVIVRQLTRLAIALGVMLVLAQIPPSKYQLWAPWLFTFSITLLLTVLIVGHIGKGAQRWLDLWILRFQPSEMLKLTIPLMLAWYFHYQVSPPGKSKIMIALLIILVPAVLIAKQPDLGTALLVSAAGACVIVLAGIRWRHLIALLSLALIFAPALWHVMHDYQRERVLTFLNPERDPLGSGYHIIQSKIAIGSGGIYGKGWLNGTQSHLQFLPEHATDFIFAVAGEEFGLIGCIILLLIFLMIVARGLYISVQAQDTFTRLLAGSITLTFFIASFINMGMVMGILPVVGLPLPLVSYGGTSMVTMIASLGILMSIQTHRKLVAT